MPEYELSPNFPCIVIIAPGERKRKQEMAKNDNATECVKNTEPKRKAVMKHNGDDQGCHVRQNAPQELCKA